MKAATLISSTLAATLAVTKALPAAAQEVQVTETQTRPSQPLLTSGLFTFGASYIPAFVVASSSDHPGDRELFVPVAGPWLDLTNRYCPAGQVCEREDLYKGLLIADGIFQAIGAFDIVGAFLFPETVTVTRKASARAEGFHLAPVTGAGVYGVAAYGSF